MKKFISIIMVVVLVMTSISVTAINSAAIDLLTPDEYGFVDRGDTKLEYGVYGTSNSQPLVVLSGNSSSMHGHDDNILPEMIKHYKVITFSTRGTGNTPVGSKRFTFDLYADDLAAVLDHLNIQQTYIYGYSDGGNLGLVFTLRYPERVTKLCVQSPNLNISGTKFFSEAGIIWNYIVYSIKCIFNKSEENLRKRGFYELMAYQPNMKFSDMKKIKIPVLHIYAEDDMIYRSHSERITKSIPDCKSIMVKGATHTTAFYHTYDIINPALLEFFK